VDLFLQLVTVSRQSDMNVTSGAMLKNKFFKGEADNQNPDCGPWTKFPVGMLT
jgi:hypothetical protein